MSIADDIYFIKAKFTDPNLKTFCYFHEGDSHYQCPFFHMKCSYKTNCRKLLQDYLEEFKEDIFDTLL